MDILRAVQISSKKTLEQSSGDVEEALREHAAGQVMTRPYTPRITSHGGERGKPSGILSAVAGEDGRRDKCRTAGHSMNYVCESRASNRT